MPFGLALAFALLLTACQARPASPPSPTKAARPDIVLVLADDLAWRELELIEAPMGGLTFRNFFAVQSLCCPSRTSMLRGQYSHNHDVRTNDGIEAQRRWERLEKDTVATRLRAAGYRTVAIGKLTNVHADKDQPMAGWDAYFVPAPNSKDASVREMFSGVVIDSAEDQIDALAAHTERAILEADGTPLLLWVAPYAPHKGSTIPARYAEAPVEHANPEVVERARGTMGYRDLIARIQGALRAAGRLSNTYIFFASDNGTVLAEPAKDRPEDDAVRVPLVVSGPGVAERERDELVANIDLAPTWLELAGLEVPDWMDGRSLVPLLRRTGERWPRKAILLDHPAQDGGLIPRNRAVRTARYAYVEWEGRQPTLWDYERDGEQVDVYSERAAASFRQQLEKLKGCAGPSCREADR